LLPLHERAQRRRQPQKLLQLKGIEQALVTRGQRVGGGNAVAPRASVVGNGHPEALRDMGQVALKRALRVIRCQIPQRGLLQQIVP
jgi:hypothetical protein